MIKDGKRVLKTSEEHTSVRREWTNYYTAIQDADSGLVRIYYSSSGNLDEFQSICPDTYYTESADGVGFSEPRALLSLHGASSNFHIFHDPRDREYPYKILVYPNITYQKDLEKDSYVVVLHNVIKELNIKFIMK